jgi:toxin ParE2
LTIRFVGPAKRELLQHSQFYDERLRGLGDAFLDEIARSLRLIKQFPAAAPFDETTRTRRRRLRRFPIAIIYRDKQDEIIVFAVAHGKRKPNYWKRRTGGS